MLLILVATTVSGTISLVNAVTANTKLRKEVKAYKAYYNARLPISKINFCSITSTVCEDSTSLISNRVN
jgi:hypothetical protein